MAANLFSLVDINLDDRRSKGVIRSINPSNEQILAEIPESDIESVERAFEGAEKAFKTWSKTAMSARIELLEKLKNLLLEKAESMAELIASEQGKPISEAILVEILPAIDALDFYINRGEKLIQTLKVRHWQVLFREKKGYYRFDPLGIVAVISPWNYPFVIPFLDVVASLFVGNTVVLKPSSTTPLVGLAIAQLFKEFDAPEGILNVVIGRSAVGEVLVKHPKTSAILFTGSVETGKRIMEMAASGVKKVILELGGKDPAVVMADADLERAANGIVWGAFMNAGQTCASIERVYVHEDVFDKFLELVIEKTKNLTIGDPLDAETDIGPMTTAFQRKLVESHLREAVESGAEVVLGGKRPFDKGYFFEPTILTGVTHSMRIMRDETFGPTMPIMKFRTLDEAIALANDTSYGLTASIWTRDPNVARKFVENVDAGTITVNDHVFSFGEPEGAWGGVKDSGVGRTHGRFGLLELVNLKFVSEDFTRRKTQFWWYPYDSELFKLAKTAGFALYGKSFGVKIKALTKFVPHLQRLISTTGMWNLIKNFKRFV
ncbi:MAG: aldehyde dehydrogenase [Candidatus Hydrothermota bacterium]|nr:MAG: aldehyde dehydrogenase [Candidatus Hydrothermae bacterium]